MEFIRRSAKGATDFLSSLDGAKAKSANVAQSAPDASSAAADPLDLQKALQDMLADAGSMDVKLLAKHFDIDAGEVERIAKPLIEKRILELSKSGSGMALGLTEIGQRALRYAKIAKV